MPTRLPDISGVRLNMALATCGPGSGSVSAQSGRYTNQRPTRGSYDSLMWVRGVVPFWTGVMESSHGSRAGRPESEKRSMRGGQEGGKKCCDGGRDKHEFRVTWGSKQVQEWDRDALKGHSYIPTDRGPFKSWLYRLGKEDSPICPSQVDLPTRGCGPERSTCAQMQVGGGRGRQIGGGHGFLQGGIQISVGSTRGGAECT